MIINLSEVMSVQNKTERIEAPVELKSFPLDGVEYSFAEGETVSLELVSEKEKQVSLKANGSVSLHIPCSRCLDDVLISFPIHERKNLDFTENEADRVEELKELNYIDGYNLDIDLFIFDGILLRFPMQVLCKKDCKGICMVCGRNLNKEHCDCSQSSGDPRMSVIQDIFMNYKEV